jgi:predicted dinucleotide-binding enzyme
MRVGILGTGDVSRALAKGFAALGHEVKIGSRSATNEKAAAIVGELGGKGSAGTFADAARFGEVVVLATLGAVNDQVIAAAGPENLAGKVFIDTTNPLDFSKGMPPSLLTPEGGSGGAQVQALAPESKVVKAFNSIGSPFMFKPTFPGGPPTMFIAGNDAGAKASVTDLLKDFGWETLDVGPIQNSHHLEGLCILWVMHGALTGKWGHAFKMLHLGSAAT